MRTHHLRQQGHSLQHIADTLKTSVATVQSDLKLVDARWSSVAAATADDLLFYSLKLLQLRLTTAIKRDFVSDNANRLTPVEYLRARDAQQTQLNGLAREIRRTVQDVHRRAEQRPDQPDLYEEEPQEQQERQELAETTPKLSQIEPSDSTISSPEQEIVQSGAEEENSLPESPQSPEIDPVISEAIELFPHLRGQSEDQILTFLDQITNPNNPETKIPTPIYAEAAG